MKFRLKKITSRRAFFIYVAFIILVTVSSVYIFSNLITDLTEKEKEILAEQDFFKRQEFLSQEFSKLLEQENRIKYLLKISNPDNLSSNLKVLSSVQTTNSLIVNNWFQINDEKIQFGNDSTANRAEINDTENFVLQHKNADHISTIVPFRKEWIWRVYFKLISKNHTTVRFGYDISLKKFRDYLSIADKTRNNYAFIFDQNGKCIYHPDSTFIGKNIYEVSSIRPIDTVYSKNQDYVKKITMSEYLKLDVIRFTKRLDVKGSHWFICVNFPKIFINENADRIRKYSTWIYSITTVMLLLIFYLFSYANLRAYREKGIAIKEKNRLLVENEKIVKEKALIQLQQLKEQINPHFLFNSLNSLYMLVGTDVKTAQKFTLNLSRIYRYLIDPPKKNIVLLKDELLFIEKYIFLQQTRFKEELFFSIKIEDETALEKFIPYLAFQVVVENAIKHNMATQENPLTTQIIIQKDQVIISNNLQKKTHSEPGANFGLKYLSSIYTFYSRTNFETSEKDGNFVCILPLISIHS
ncbi:sensor histidine kinase [Flavobacterium hibisci]|uniref:sensor histidine kinase n=1 Tax=Flavobacterium hibisci TaxID=1914462 RepID=UPI001CBFF180|nr:histidine kinase [Flavobacterium hibisci]MBZ4044149.1 histidine kinase [Flavobacterium hibisci]